MKQLLILSGKGGTGKTTVASAFIKLAQSKAFADCDVDAPNLHLVVPNLPSPKRTHYFGLDKAEMDSTVCTQCGLCKQYCRFDAIVVEAEQLTIDLYACEGCGVCEKLCPVQAIELKPAVAGEKLLYKNESVFSTAQLKMGSGNTGLLVTEVKKQLQTAVEEKVPFAIIDGSPGIGCPVIASLNGADLVLIVAEPSLSGMSDMERIMETAQTFQTRIAVCINKYDTNLELSKQIQSYCEQNNIDFVGTIPFDKQAVQAVNRGCTIVDTECAAGKAVQDVYRQTIQLL